MINRDKDKEISAFEKKLLDNLIDLKPKADSSSENPVEKRAKLLSERIYLDLVKFSEEDIDDLETEILTMIKQKKKRQ